MKDLIEKQELEYREMVTSAEDFDNSIDCS